MVPEFPFFQDQVGALFPSRHGFAEARKIGVFCPGAGLSRMEQVATLEAVLDRLPNPRLSDRNDYTHVPMFAMRSLRALHVDFDAAGVSASLQAAQ